MEIDMHRTYDLLDLIEYQDTKTTKYSSHTLALLSKVLRGRNLMLTQQNEPSLTGKTAPCVHAGT